MLGALYGKIVVRFQQLADVVRVQHRIQRRLPQSIAAVRHDVGQRANQHAEIAVECAHTADRLRQIVIPRPAIALRASDAASAETAPALLHRHGPAAGTAAAMRRRKRLVQIQVHHIDAEIARPRDADQRIHVRAVHVDQRAFGVQNVRRSCVMFSSNTPSVFGLVIISAGDVFRRRALAGSRSTMPRSFDLMFSTE